MIEKSYKKRMTAWGAEINSREVDYDPEELKRQLASGLKLQQIAGNFGVCDNTLHKWRKAQGCPTNAPKKPITPELFQMFEDLYKQGYRDIEIAQKTTHAQNTVKKWRESKGYPPQKKPTQKIFDQMYGEGCRNYIILAKATGLASETMRKWVDNEIKKEASKAENPKTYYNQARKKLKDLNSNRVIQEALKRQMNPELFQMFEDLYKQGYRDIEIAQKTVQSQQSQYMVKKWRESRGYPPNKKPARIIFERMYSEGCRNYIALAEATGLAESTIRTWVYREVRKEASKAEDPEIYYRRIRAKLRSLNSNKVDRRLPRYRTCTILLKTADAQTLAKSRNEAINRISSRVRELDNIGNQANLLGTPEYEITDKDAVQKSKCRSKNKAKLDTAYQGCPNFDLDRWRWCQGVRKAAKIKVV